MIVSIIELRRLALKKLAEESSGERTSPDRFRRAAGPAAILELIAEIERLRSELEKATNP